MHVGTGVIFQNPGRAQTDYDVYRRDLRLIDLAEPLGFESIWGVEHHFTDYTMCPDVLQFLTYCAGRTQHALLGSMVVVLPWHDPLRVAEQVAMLDHVSNGRFVLGLGRGLGRVEFEGFRVPMTESRGRFVESAKMLLQGLESGFCEYDGEHVKQPRVAIRPRPFRTFRGRTYAAAVSPESFELMAQLGVGLLIIPQKPWETVAQELAQYREVYRGLHRQDPIAPWASAWVFCDRDAERARELARRFIGGYYHTVVDHYEFAGAHLQGTRGYEFYGRMQQMAGEAGGTQKMLDFFVDLQVWGTPAQCVERIRDIQSRVGNRGFTAIFSYAGMPEDEAERNLRLFADEVLPALKALPDPALAAAG